MSDETADQAQVIRALHGELIGFARSLHRIKHAYVGSLIGPGGVPVIARLATEGPMRASALAECTTLDPSTVSRQVDHLVKGGLVRRLADPQDGRATLLEATEVGAAEFADYRRRVASILDALLADWTPDQIESLTVALRRLNEDAAIKLPELIDSPRRATPGTPSVEENLPQ